MAFKLTAGFALVALVGVLIVAFLANRLTSNAFGSYVEQGVPAQDQIFDRFYRVDKSIVCPRWNGWILRK